MPSAALLNWRGDRLARLAVTDALCDGLFGPIPVAGLGQPLGQPLGLPIVPLPLAFETLQGYVMLLSGHFQGFCRDLYSECVQACVAPAAPAMQASVQRQFSSELRLGSGNPTLENIRKDFERFAITLDLGIDPANQPRITDLGHLNYWRNATAHQLTTVAPAGIPATLTLASVRTWRASCDGLAASLDDIMYRKLTIILGVAPW